MREDQKNSSDTASDRLWRHDEPTIVLAVVAGLVSLLPSWMLPAIPAFRARLAGASSGAAELRRQGLFVGGLLFVTGFSTVFAILGVALNAALREAAAELLALLSHPAGTVVTLLGLHLVGLLPLLNREHSVLAGKDTA